MIATDRAQINPIVGLLAFIVVWAVTSTLLIGASGVDGPAVGILTMGVGTVQILVVWALYRVTSRSQTTRRYA